MTVRPVEFERLRFWVDSETAPGVVHLVDLQPGHDLPKCSCAIDHNRTAPRWNCKHVRAVMEFVRSQKLAPARNEH